MNPFQQGLLATVLVALAFFGGVFTGSYLTGHSNVHAETSTQGASTTFVTRTEAYGSATARVVFAINATMQTTTSNFSIPDIPYKLPNGTLFQITRIETPPLFDAPFHSCTMTIHILEYTTNHRSSFFAYPMWITFNENPCDSNGPTTYHMFHDAKVIKEGTVKQTQP